MSDKKTTSVTILDKSYQVAVPAGQQVALTASARHLDQQMRLIRDTGKVVGLERIAVMAALNISNDFLQHDAETKANNRYANNGIEGLVEKVDEALEKFGKEDE
ncbi:MAG: cell division protein ZapA [Pseudomonadales bacterium]